MKKPPKNRLFKLLAAPCALLALTGAIAFADDTDPPAKPPFNPTPAPAPDDDLTPWGISADPNTRFWDVMYLKGTTPELQKTLNSQVVEFDDKLADVLAQLTKLDQDAANDAAAALATLREKADYKALQQQISTAKTDAETARTSGASAAERMSASSKYNRLKADLDRMERDVVVKTSAPNVKAARAELQRRADTFRTKRAEALVWRQKTVDAIIFGQTMHGELEPGETIGLIMDAVVDRVTPQKDVIAHFPLLVSAKVVGMKEGVKQLQGHKEMITLVLKKLDDIQRLQPRQKLNLPFAFKVTGTEQVGGEEAYVLEPYACDFNHLLKAMVTLPPLKAPMEAAKATPAPTKKGPEKK